MIQIIFCTDGIFPFSIGGMQRHSRLLIEQLSSNDELEIIVLHPHEHKVFNNIRIKEINIPGINKDGIYLMECYKYSKKVYGVLTKYPKALIYSQGLSVWYNSAKLKDRLIANPHGLEPFQAIGFKNKLQSIPFKIIFKRIFKNSCCVISLGGKLTEILHNNVSKNTKIIELNNGINLPLKYFKKINCNETIEVLFLGRFASNKGIDVLFKAIEVLNSEGFQNTFHFTLGGNGPLLDFYQKNNSFKNVQLLGFIDDENLADIFSKNELFVLPTLFEGMPTVVLEAMSHGLSIIVSDVGATKLMVDDSNGKLIQAGSINALVDALKWYSRLDFKSRSKLSENSYVKVSENFTWEKIAGDHLDLFKTFKK